MTPNTAQLEPILHDAFIEMLEAEKLPDAQLVEDIVSDYPQFAAEITDFAVELALDMLVNADDDEVAAIVHEEISPLVSRALSNFQNELYLREQAPSTSEDRLASVAPETKMIDPFASMDRKSFGDFSQSIHANKIFAVKFRDKQINPATIPNQYLDIVAEKLNCTVDLLLTYLNGQERRPAMGTQFFKADDRPNHDLQQSFDEAVENSGLNDDQKRFLQSLN